MLSKNRIKQIAALKNAKQRALQKQFLIEGTKLIRDILKQKPAMVEEVLDSTENEIIYELCLQSKIKYTTIEKEVSEKIAVQQTSQGVFAVCGFFHQDAEVLEMQNKIVFYLNEVQDPGNAGTIIRIADWFGIDAVVFGENTVDIYNTKVLQAAMGSFAAVGIYKCLNTEAFFQKAKQRETNIYSTTMNGESLKNISIQHGIIILGNEGNGITEDVRNFSNKNICIEGSQNRFAESLNVAVTSAIIANHIALHKN